ncbi:MAG: hypothetical protein QOH96_4326 [Blastocatellia bacterium]|nr:hypothetical protein [Blastocatellia bacterium]
MKKRELLTSIFLVFFIFVSLSAFSHPHPYPATKRVLIISIDGLDARYLTNRDEYGLKVPTLRRLMANGVTADGVVGVYPTLTYPSHTTLVTGALPIRHGIFGNDVPGPPGADGRINALWYARDIKADTIWDASNRAGMKVGLVSWPVAAGAGDYNVPEIWKPGGKLEDSLQVVAANAKPAGLMGEIEKADPEIYKKMTADEGDDSRTRSTEFIVEKKKPEVMLVHLWDLDHWEHKDGPFTPSVFAILEKVDAYVSRILGAYQRAGILDETTVFLVSDHGFKPVTRQINPGVLLVKNGLVNIGEINSSNGKPRAVVANWKAFPYPTAGSCAITLRDPNDLETLNKVLEVFKPLAGRPGTGILKVFEREEIRKLGGDTDAAVILEAADGYYFGGGLTGDIVVDGTQKGTHGYLPLRYQTSFIASGPGVGKRGSLGQVRMIDIGPTIASVLGVKLRDAQGIRLSL